MLCLCVRSSAARLHAERDSATISQIIWNSMKHALLFLYAHAVNKTLFCDDSSYAVWLCPALVR